MSSKSSNALAIAKGRKAALKRHRGPADPATLAADTELREAVLDAHIRKIVDAWPPLTAAQRDRLALLIRGGDAA